MSNFYLTRACQNVNTFLVRKPVPDQLGSGINLVMRCTLSSPSKFITILTSYVPEINRGDLLTAPNNISSISGHGLRGD